MDEKKKKKAYCKPEMHIEQFTPNEYVGACWGVACSVDDANTYEKNHYFSQRGPGGGTTWYDHGCTHSSDHCGDSGNQVIRTSDWAMKEIGTDGLGTLTCMLSDANYESSSNSFAGVTVGSTIYWTTKSGDKVWHHKGTVFSTNSTKPNMS